MAAEVHAVAAIVDRLRDATDLRVRLEHDGPHVGAPQQLQCGGEAGGSGADDDCGLGHQRALATSGGATGENRKWRRSRKFVQNVHPAASSLPTMKCRPPTATATYITPALTSRPTAPSATNQDNSMPRCSMRRKRKTKVTDNTYSSTPPQTKEIGSGHEIVHVSLADQHCQQPHVREQGDDGRGAIRSELTD